MPNSIMPEGWNCAPRLLSHSRYEARERFVRPILNLPCWGLMTVESGAFGFRLGRGQKAQDGECRVGQWVLVPPGVALRREILSLATFQFFDLEFEEAPRSLIGRGELRDAARLREIVAALARAVWDDNTLHWREHLLLDWLRTALWEQQSAPAPVVNDPEMATVCARLEAGFTNKISLAQVARECHLTPVTLTRRFRTATGQTPSEFLMQLRLDTARRLLLSTSLNLEEIARACGFGDGFYFSRVWKNHTGEAPAHFRRSQRA